MKSLILLSMTKEQAHMFFPHSAGDNLKDLWEQRFFEQKQFFLTRPPIRIVWMSRLKKLKKQFTAYLLLTDQEIPEENIPIDFHQEIVFSDEFIAAFHQFHRQRNEHKSKILRANSFNELVQAIEDWLETEFLHAEHWSLPECEHDETEVIRSKEPDPMELLKELKETETKIKSPLLHVLKENYNILSENVKKEVKRLTLLAKV